MPALSLALVTAEGASPSRWVVFLHGILGSGANWRSFARQLVARRPGWGAALVDLRLHGASLGYPPPHTLAACAADVRATLGNIPGPVHGLVGHSFGGKVALEYLREPGELELAWVLDSSPSARPTARGSEDTVRIVSLLERLPSRFASRDAFTQTILDHGYDRAIAMWLAMQVKPAPDGDGYEWRLDLHGIREMLDDYFQKDEWDVVEHCPVGSLAFVVGGKSNVLSAEDIARARAYVKVHVLPEAGHWVHVDAPAELLSIVADGTPD